MYCLFFVTTGVCKLFFFFRRLRNNQVFVSLSLLKLELFARSDFQMYQLINIQYNHSSTVFNLKQSLFFINFTFHLHVAKIFDCPYTVAVLCHQLRIFCNHSYCQRLETSCVSQNILEKIKTGEKSNCASLSAYCIWQIKVLLMGGTWEHFPKSHFTAAPAIRLCPTDVCPYEAGRTRTSTFRRVHIHADKRLSPSLPPLPPLHPSDLLYPNTPFGPRLCSTCSTPTLPRPTPAPAPFQSQHCVNLVLV